MHQTTQAGDVAFPEYAFIFAIGWVLLCAIVSAWYRAKKGKPVLFWTAPEAHFVAHFASGYSGRGIAASFAGASSCLVVAVTSDRFVVRPWFPFNLLFLPEIYKLEAEVPLTNVNSVEWTRMAIVFRAIRVKFVDQSSNSRTLTLRLRGAEELHRLLDLKMTRSA
jgi:hypothetical protein